MLRKLLPRRPGPAAVVGYLALFLALGGGALGATSAFTGSGGRIHGCVDVKGALTVLKAPATRCGTGKTAISWNQKGPRGIQGLRGPQGAQGIQGAQGLQGSTGPPGPGATSIPITNYPLNSSQTIMTVHGIRIDYKCDPGVVGLYVGDLFGSKTVYISGVKAVNNTLSAINESDVGALFAGSSGTVNLDVIATVDGTWVRIDLGGFYGGANGCNIWGLVIPGT